MSNLRNKIIRLAHENPSLRKDLLPLLKEGKKATQNKEANWSNIVTIFENRDQFRMTIGAENMFTDGENSLDYLLKNSLPRVEKSLYLPIVNALQNNPDIALYRLPQFRTLKGSVKRKSIIIGWTISGSKPEDMDLGSYLKGLGIRSNWDFNK